MKRTHMLLCQRLLLLLILSLAAYRTPQPVEAETGNQKKPSPIFVGMMTPDLPGLVCVGRTIKNLEYYFIWLRMPLLIPRLNTTVTISATNGTVEQPQSFYPSVIVGHTVVGKFSYTAKKEGKETIQITAGQGESLVDTIYFSFEVHRCKASLQFNQEMTYSYGVASIINNYFGNGTISANNENGQVSGSGVQAIWSSILPYSLGRGSCTHNAPWESISGITFSGQVGENGDTSVTMEMEALSVNTTSLTCTDGEYTASMPFPGYTYSPCQVQLAGFNFEAATLDVPFNCPGQAPFTVPITIIPRRES